MTTRHKKPGQSRKPRHSHASVRPSLPAARSATWALTHRSLAYETNPETLPDPAADNEQLEFVGDAVLGLAVAESLFRRFPASREGELTRLRASLVSRRHLGEVAARIDLGSLLRLGRGEEQSGGRRKPALLANALEAVIAALYLDGGLDAARAFIEKHIIEPALPDLHLALKPAIPSAEPSATTNPPCRSTSRPPAPASPLRPHRPERARPPKALPRRSPHRRQVGGSRALAESEGTTKKQAQQDAARLAFERLIAESPMQPSCRSGGQPNDSRRRVKSGQIQASRAAHPSQRPVSNPPSTGAESSRTATAAFAVTLRTAQTRRPPAVQSLLHLIVIAIFIITFCVQPFRIPSESMESTLLVGDFLLVDKQVAPPRQYRWLLSLPPAIHRGDIIVFHYPVDPTLHLVKRVIGLPGDHIRLRRGRVFINGQPLAEPYAVYRPSPPDNFRDNFPRLQSADPEIDSRWWIRMRSLIDDGELIIPTGNYFVLGDNRNDSEDSRYWGFVPREAIVGKPLLIYFSLQQPEGTSARPQIGIPISSIRFARWDRTMHVIH